MEMNEGVEEGPSTSLGLNGFGQFRSRRAESLLALLLLAACSEVPATTIDVGNTTVEVQVEPSLSFSPGRLDFGVLAGPRELTVELHNHTHRDLSLTALTFSSAAFRSATAMPLVVPAAGAAQLAVEAIPASAAAFDATLRVSTDADDQPELVIPLLANRTAPCLAVSTARLDFGPVELGCRSRDQRVVLTNTCPHQVKTVDTTASVGFAVISGPPRTGLAPGGAVELALRSAPAAEGPASGMLTISADVLDGTQVLTMPLSGLGTPAVILEESETLPPRFQRDVLLVIDDSAAMLPLAESVRANLDSFAMYAAFSGEEVRIGVMTTSTAPGEIGRLKGWLDAPTPAALQALTEVKGLATSRSSCLEVLAAAFTPPLSPELTAMLRPRVGLQVVCVTNGRDALESAPMPVISSILSALPRPRVINVIASFVEVPGCPGVREHGPLSALVAHVDGRLEEICTPNWAVALDPGKNAFGYRTWFYLQQRPSFVRGPLRLWLDAVEVPAEIDGTRIWEYSGAENAVFMEPLYVPAPGQTVRFRYTPDCR